MYGFSKKKKSCNIIIRVYYNLAKKKVYIYFIIIIFTFWVHFTFLCRLILPMGGIVINSCQTVPIVLKSRQRIGLAGISFYYFLLFTQKKKKIIYWFFNYIAFENLGARVGAWKIHTELSKILLSLLQGFSSIVAPLWTITWYAYF